MTRSKIAVVTAVMATGVACTVVETVTPKFVWNASASAPIGFYWIDGGSFSVSDLVAVEPPESLATLLADRGYLPRGALLLKHILAVSGQTVCRNNLNVSVDGNEVGTALVRDRSGRDLPSWQGCQRVPPGAVFLMNRQIRDSFDGRYFGFVTTDHIIGRAVPLWAQEQSEGRFQWRSPTR